MKFLMEKVSKVEIQLERLSHEIEDHNEEMFDLRFGARELVGAESLSIEQRRSKKSELIKSNLGFFTNHL